MKTVNKLQAAERRLQRTRNNLRPTQKWRELILMRPGLTLQRDGIEWKYIFNEWKYFFSMKSDENEKNITV